MCFRPFARAFALALGVSVVPLSALAQSPACDRYRAELSALDRGPDRDEEAARRQRSELTRMTGYYRSIGCGAARSFFDQDAPEAACNAIAQRIRALQASVERQDAGDFAGTDTVSRRRQLTSAIDRFCRVREREPEPGWRRSFDDPFDDDPPPARDRIVQEPGRIMDDPGSDQGGSSGSDKRICVKTCDGSFFPLENTGRADADEMCQALCPGTEAHAYSVPQGPTVLDQAISVRGGERYGDLPNAFRFQKKADSSCACKREGESWAQVLQRAEGLLDKRDGDVVVSAEQAEQLSRAKVQKRSGPARERTGKSTPATGTGAGASKAPARPKEASAVPSDAGSAALDAGGRGQGREGLKNQASRLPAKPRIRVVAPGVLPDPGQNGLKAP